ncbi:hypothetical protein CALVIDRAFT_414138 [Calocera viscosa TUFC12733]|uniref:Uncharacterized protein n=1 Tax=Calocera viscosa (strain TUFC12733) TaxID=1330018 RepID=A0A167G3W3_CALVF|nr:hypothetical protein CALVIDRAFT_414138 [Calocera viscosa TUFC12733]
MSDYISPSQLTKRSHSAPVRTHFRRHDRSWNGFPPESSDAQSPRRSTKSAQIYHLEHTFNAAVDGPALSDELFYEDSDKLWTRSFVRSNDQLLEAAAMLADLQAHGSLLLHQIGAARDKQLSISNNETRLALEHLQLQVLQLRRLVVILVLFYAAPSFSCAIVCVDERVLDFKMNSCAAYSL